ncbi:prepilin-type N-terminal cleavage/methylation domain-containing protein [Patescibacteria group bacterium]|nr:prepilin-type N-terminal cleavage/methylation domain-containing protein [Patescibacteria group bacterium]
MRRLKNERCNNSFTLIELLIVVAIIGILAALIIVSVTSASAKARDIKRQEDLKNIQKALEMYYTTNGSYPSTASAKWGYCSGFGSHGISGSSGYIPNLAPTYIPSLPLDPRNGTDCQGAANVYACYWYESNGTDYKVDANETVETTLPTATNSLQNFWDPVYGIGGSIGGGPPDTCDYSLYTPGGKNF